MRFKNAFENKYGIMITWDTHYDLKTRIRFFLIADEHPINESSKISNINVNLE